MAGDSFAERVQLYARSLRHLRWEQWVYRPLRRFQRRAPRETLIEAGDIGEIARLSDAVISWGPLRGEAETLSRASAIVNGDFTFLNHTERLQEIDWSRRYVSHLWSYNLHYFDYGPDLAWAYRISGDRRYIDRFTTLTLSWIEGSRSGGDGWEPYSLSLRIVNWIYAVLLLGDALDERTHVRLNSSIAAQLHFLARRLELHILANHLQKNLKGLVVGGLYLGGRSADALFGKGSRQLWRELLEQVLPDGTHYERSPMYHAIALGDFLEVASLLRAVGREIPGAAMERIERMAEAQGVLADASGRLHPFNDAAQGIAPPFEWLSALSLAVTGRDISAPDGLLELERGGYFGVQASGGHDRLLIDCGPLGPDYQPGHGHCDLLSFEWIVGGRPVVVDSGVHGYDGDWLREYSRSTRAHNTVGFGDEEQAEVWGTFRVGGRPEVREAGHSLSENVYEFEGAYSPHFDRNLIHRRRLILESESLTVHDRVDGRTPRPAASYLHLHPDFTLARQGQVYVARTDEMELRIEPVGADRVEIARGERTPEQGWYCPEFGRAFAAPTLILRSSAASQHRFGYRIQYMRADQKRNSVPLGDVRGSIR